MTTGTDEATGEPVVEVTHEALIRGWPELRGWIDEDRDRLRAERRLSDAAAEWDRGGRDEGALYRGARLAAVGGARHLRADPAGAGVPRREHRAGRARPRRRRRKRVAVAIGGSRSPLAAIAGVAVFALVQRNDANDQRDVAALAPARRPTRAAAHGDPELCLLLARDAPRDGPDRGGGPIYREATHASQVRRGVPRPRRVRAGGGVHGGRRDHRERRGRRHVRLWHPARDAPTRSITGHDGDVFDVAISPDGRAWERRRRRHRAAHAARERIGPRPPGHEGPVETFAFRADGRMLATGGDDGPCALAAARRRAMRASEARRPARGRLRARRLGQRVGNGGIVRTWGADGRPLTSRATRGRHGLRVAVSLQGVTRRGGSDLRVRIWRPGETAPAHVLRAADFSGARRRQLQP